MPNPDMSLARITQFPVPPDFSNLEEVKEYLLALRKSLILDAYARIEDFSNYGTPITAEKITEGAVTESKLADEAITELKLADRAVTNAKIAIAAVHGDVIAAGAITAEKIMEGAVTELKLANEAVTAAKLAVAAVTDAKIAANAITNDKIANAAITASKIGNAYKILEIVDSLPAAGTAGRIVYLTTDGKIYRDNGTVWKQLILPSDVTNHLGGEGIGTIGTVKIDTGAITEAKIAAGAITETKIADNAISSPKIVAGAILADKIAAGAITTEKLDALAITADKIAANAITTAKLAAGAVTTEKLVAGSVTSDILAANAVIAGKIAADAVATAQLAAEAVTAAKIAAGAITAEKIAADAVTSDKIVANAITTAKIAAGAVTTEKIAANAIVASKIAAGAITSEKIEALAITGEKIAADSITTQKLVAKSVVTEKINDAAVTPIKQALEGSSIWLPPNGKVCYTYRNGHFYEVEQRYFEAGGGADGSYYYWYKGLLRFNLWPIWGRTLAKAELRFLLASKGIVGSGANAQVALALKAFTDYGLIDKAGWNKTVRVDYGNIVQYWEAAGAWRSVNVKTRVDNILAGLSEDAEYSGNLCLGGTPSSSSGTARNAFDNDGIFASGETVCVMGSQPQWLRYQLLSAQVINKYTIQGPWHPSDASNYGPTAWSFQGSNDGTNWTTLDTRSGISWSGGEVKSFTFSNSTAYLYYQLYFTATPPGGQIWVVDVEMMKALGNIDQKYLALRFEGASFPTDVNNANNYRISEPWLYIEF